MVLNRPILATILSSRMACAAITIVSGVQLGLVSAGLPGWQSPLHTLLGVPDPGCGLSRAVVALFRGNWKTSLTYHAFAPFLVAALGLMAVSMILPRTPRDRIVALVGKFEQRSGLTAILLIGLVVYWLGRLLIMQETFFRLVAR